MLYFCKVEQKVMLCNSFFYLDQKFCTNVKLNNKCQEIYIYFTLSIPQQAFKKLPALLWLLDLHYVCSWVWRFFQFLI